MCIPVTSHIYFLNRFPQSISLFRNISQTDTNNVKTSIHHETNCPFGEVVGGGGGGVAEAELSVQIYFISLWVSATQHIHRKHTKTIISACKHFWWRKAAYKGISPLSISVSLSLCICVIHLHIFSPVNKVIPICAIFSQSPYKHI